MDGQLQEGWREQEWRWKKYDFIPRRFADRPQWDGSSLAGKTIRLLVEQGYGDMFQFCRYVPLLADQGASVLLETVPDIYALMSRLRGVGKLIRTVEESQPFDFVCPLMSVPLLYGTDLGTIPAQVPYLQPDPVLLEQWREFFAAEGNLKVGIAWAGRPTHANDHNRSTTLAAFAPLLRQQGVTFYSLQKGTPGDPIRRPALVSGVVDLSDRLTDFDQTAAAIAALDLIISVDTALVHLAGAMARPVWTLLPFSPDWRWMLHREDSPWYPTMRLFRLPRRKDWAAVMEKAAEALKTEIDRRTRPVQ
jgi:Glycosyltransferase family 9 (heptosyltransferase)